ncbi:MAG: ATP-dependent DNA helicase RecQ [Polyangiaceae bacterium]|nr:ATP-dependent DNA helicase RecQ [Polyangiaceae bacterium]
MLVLGAGLAHTPRGVTALASLDLDAGLKRLGYDEFRPGQRESILALLEHGKLLLVAPTGGGKSLCYQLPGSLLPGTTVVISPLIALMHDQVEALTARGIAATYLAATLPPEETRRRLANLARGEYQMLYVAPERLGFPGFRATVRALSCPLVAIDEAHCISEWGHDFRPDYLGIGDFVRQLSGAKILACTATATPIVRDEILQRLGLGADTPQVLRGFARPNLILRAREISTLKEREKHVDATLGEALGKPKSPRGTAILYSLTRKGAEREAERLSSLGWGVVAYHAGLASKDRERAQARFISGEVNVVVATNAFGMGIDRGDVRAVVHLGPPGSIEAYYQEVGRAGRDGEPAIGLLLARPQDLTLRRQLLQSEADGRVPDPAIVEHKWNLFLELMRWVEGGTCRHDAILRYFEDEAETLQGCGRCDVCLGLATEDDASEQETALIVRKALSAVARVHAQMGLTAAVKLARGQKDPRLERSGLESTPTFGVLKSYSEEWLTKLLRRCMTAGWLSFTKDERPLIRLTQEGREVMKGLRPIRLRLPPRDRSPGAGFGKGQSERGSRAEEAVDPASHDLFEALRAHRLEIAQTQGVPAYVVASDRTLRDIALLRPQTEDQLLLVHGIGPAKAAAYGAGFLGVVRERGDVKTEKR